MIFAPGSRAVIRGEEWLIRRVDPSTDGGWLLTCDGVSELDRGHRRARRSRDHSFNLLCAPLRP